MGGAETDAAARTPGARSAARRGTSPSDEEEEEEEEEEVGVARVGARGRRVSPFDRRAANARTRAVVIAGADMAAPSALVVDATVAGGALAAVDCRWTRPRAPAKSSPAMVATDRIYTEILKVHRTHKIRSDAAPRSIHNATPPTIVARRTRNASDERATVCRPLTDHDGRAHRRRRPGVSRP
tara:strand:+ start:363 stop:911 length:549 start_codon:yes stop_codon:yes gene_type:complete